MKKIVWALACVCFVSLSFSSCIVSKKKYDAEKARADKEHGNAVELGQRLANANELIRKANKTIADLNAEIAALKQSIEGLEGKVAGLEDTKKKLNNTVADLNGRLDNLDYEKEKTNRQLDKTREQMAEQRRKMEQLQALLDQQQKATEALRKKITDALSGFNSDELTVTMKNGKVYISMMESLLFPSGSAEVNPKGKEALKKVATVLNTSKDINIDIEGHTDSLPIHTAKFADNWALSTARATSIAHVLIDEYKVSPAKLIASGRSQYDPVAANSTPEGRSRNRRTEIILEPKLEELMDLMNNKPGAK
jgi:chemotaxis protein MotB